MTPETLCNQAIALAQQNRFAEALAVLDRVLQLKPAYGEAHHNRGLILQQIGRPMDAIAAYDRALKSHPGSADSHFQRAMVLVQLGRMADAIASFDAVLKLTPDNIGCLMNRGYPLMVLGRFDEALAGYDAAIRLAPGYADAYYARGIILMNLNRPDEAVASYDATVRVKPDHADAWTNRGVALMRCGRMADAAASFGMAVQIQPKLLDAWHNRGMALAQMGRLEDAITCFENILRIDPANRAALARKAYQQARICDWGTRDHDLALLTSGEQAGIEPFVMLALDDDPVRQLARAKAWAKQFPSFPAKPRSRPARRPEKLRLGYFSADFHDHATMNLMAGLLDRHDRSRFDIHLFSYGDAIRDAMRQRAEACAGTFHDVGRMSDDAVVELATRAKLDIAIDLKGYTKDTRIGLFARRLAPLQVSWLGYPGTLGGDFIDYIIADAQIVPEADRCFYTEKIMSLPNSYQPNDDRRVISDHVFTRVELGLPEQGVVFCCFNNNSKIGPEEFDLWMELLAQVEGSVLWLFRDNNLAAANLAREAERRGIARDRLVFAGRMPQAEHLARQRCADIFLDTFTYNAHTTASDALWAGLPVITKCGRSFAARVAASLLHAIGMPEMVVQTAEDYRKLALDLATGPERLAAVKAKLAANRLSTALFDTVTFTRDIERVYDALHAERS